MRKLFADDLPTSVVELQRLMGRLNFASNFIPNYRRLVRPLIKLMSKSSNGTWTIEHTNALNEVASAVL